MRFADPAAVHAAIVAHAASDAALRAALGDGLGSVISADALRQGAAGLPRRPLIAYRPGASLEDGGGEQHGGSWYVYDDPEQGTRRIGAVLHALRRAYDLDQGAAAPPAPLAIITFSVADRPRLDTALGLQSQRADLTART